MTVAELKEFLETQPDDRKVAYYCYSEQCVLDKDDIATVELCQARPDGWIQDKRDDMPTETYLMFPGN